MSKKKKLLTYVDLKHFDRQVFIDEELTTEEHSDVHFCKIIQEDRNYILKRCTIDLNFDEETSREKSLSLLSNVYQEYFLMKAISNFNPHFARPLAADYRIRTVSHKVMHIEMLFESHRVYFKEVKPLAITLLYGLAWQSLNALALLDGIGVVQFKIGPATSSYDEALDNLNLISMDIIHFSKGTNEATESQGESSGEGLHFSSEGAQVESGGAYSWAECFCLMILNARGEKFKQEEIKHETHNQEIRERFRRMMEENLEENNLMKPMELTARRFTENLLLRAMKETLDIKGAFSEIKEFEEKNNVTLKHTYMHKQKIMNMLLLERNSIKKKTREKGKKSKNKYYMMQEADLRHSMPREIFLVNPVRKVYFNNSDDSSDDYIVIDSDTDYYSRNDTRGYYEEKLKKLRKVCEKFKSENSCTELDINCDGIRDEEAKSIGEMFRANTTLKKLSLVLASDQLTEVGVNHIVSGFKFNKTITHLSASQKENDTFGRFRLRISPPSKKEPKYIWEIFICNKAIAHLSLCGNYLDFDSTENCSKILRTNKTLKELNLRKCSLQSEAAILIGKALESNNTLEVLNLKQSPICKEGAKAIAEALTTNTTLTILNLSCSGIESEGAKYISAALKVNKKLKKLNLSSNRLESEDISYICEALVVNTSLKRLKLKQNPMQKEGAKAIANMLKVNKTLTEISIKDSEIGDEGASHLADALKANRTLEVLKLSRNGIGELKEKELEAATQTVRLIL